MLPWAAILNWSRALAALEQHSQIPDPSTDPSLPHSPCTTHCTPNMFMGLFYPSYLLPPDQSGEYSPHPAGSSILCYLMPSFIKKRFMAFLLVCLSVPHAPTLRKYPLYRHQQWLSNQLTCSHLSVQQAIWLYLFWLSTSLLLLFPTFLHFHHSMWLTEKQFLN